MNLNELLAAVEAANVVVIRGYDRHDRWHRRAGEESTMKVHRYAVRHLARQLVGGTPLGVGRVVTDDGPRALHHVEGGRPFVRLALGEADWRAATVLVDGGGRRFATDELGLVGW